MSHMPTPGTEPWSKACESRLYVELGEQLESRICPWVSVTRGFHGTGVLPAVLMNNNNTSYLLPIIGQPDQT